MSAITDALQGLSTALRALAVALAGAWAAWQWFQGQELLTIASAAILLVVGLALDAAGRGMPKDKPRSAVELMEWWVIVPMVLAATAAAVAIIVTVELAVDKTAPTETQETIGALATAITAFLSSAFVDWTGDDKDSRVSDRIKAHFETKYQGVFASNSRGEWYVYSVNYDGADGWGRAARRKRAEGIKARWDLDRTPN